MVFMGTISFSIFSRDLTVFTEFFGVSVLIGFDFDDG